MGKKQQQQKLKQQQNTSPNTNTKNTNISLFDLIVDLQEMNEVCELRMNIKNELLTTTTQYYHYIQYLIEQHVFISSSNSSNSNNNWIIDEDNLEGIRVRVSNTNNNNDKEEENNGGSFFMLRMSLHDPIISLQIEGINKKYVQKYIVQPLLDIINSNEMIMMIQVVLLL